MKKLPIIRFLLVLTVLALVAGMSPWGHASNKGTVSDADRVKAQYVFLEAQTQKNNESFGSYYDLLRHAYSIDSTNLMVGYYLGYVTAQLHEVRRSVMDRSYEQMRRYVDANPSQYYEALAYSDMCMRAGRNNEALRVISRIAEYNRTSFDVQARLAQAYFRLGEFEKSIAVYDTIERYHGKTISLTEARIAALSELNDTARIIDAARSLYNTAPANVYYNLTLGHVMDVLEMPDSAQYYYDRALALEPDNGQVLISMASLYGEKGDTLKRDDYTYKALTSTSLEVEDKLEVLLEYSRRLLMQGDSSSRVNDLFSVLISQHPHEAGIHKLYSQYLWAIHDYAGAAEQMEYELDIDPTDPERWNALVVAYILNEKNDEALATAKKAVTMNPDNVDLYTYLGVAYFQLEHFDEAIATYDKAITLTDDPELISTLLERKGDVYHQIGDSIECFKSYDLAIEYNPDNFSVLNNYAYFLAVDGKELDKAERMSAKAVQSSPNSSTYIDTYAWVFFKKGDYDMALFYMKDALAKEEEPTSELFDHYGDILWATGAIDEAVEQWQRALELDPENELIQRKINDKTYYEK